MQRVFRPTIPSDIAVLYDLSEPEMGSLARDTLMLTGVWQTAYTLCFGTVPVMCGGIAPMWEGLGQAWALVSPVAKRHPITVTRFATRSLQKQAADGGYRRVETTVLSSDSRARVWTIQIGFVWDGEAPLYGPNGEQFTRFVWYPRGK